MADTPDPTAVVRLAVKVVPGAARSEITGWLGARLKIRISAPPEKGKANAAVETLLADTLGLPRTAVRITRGHASARKTLEITGMPAAIIWQKLGQPTDGSSG